MTILLSLDGTNGMWLARKAGDETNFRAESDSFHEAIFNLERHFEQREKRELIINATLSLNIVKDSKKPESNAKLIELTM